MSYRPLEDMIDKKSALIKHIYSVLNGDTALTDSDYVILNIYRELNGSEYRLSKRLKLSRRATHAILNMILFKLHWKEFDGDSWVTVLKLHPVAKYNKKYHYKGKLDAKDRLYLANRVRRNLHGRMHVSS